MFILKVVEKLEKYKVPYAIVGGHAVALHGAVRGTLDIDFITKWALKNLLNIQEAMHELGLKSRFPIGPKDLFNFRDEYVRNKNLVAWNFINPHNRSEQIDIIITIDLTGKSVRRFDIHGQKLNVLAKKDLIEMKRKSGRKQDLIDIEALEKLK